MQIQRRFLSGLAAALLVLMASGCMEPRERDENQVALEEAFVHAAVAMIETAVISRRPLTEQEGPEVGWRQSSISTPLILHDVSTKPLFYIFPIVRDGAVVGKIWVSANKLVGAAIPAIDTGRRSDWLDAEYLQMAIARLEELAAEKYGDWEIVWIDGIVYTYPKIGAMAVLRGPKEQEERRLVIDAGSLEMIASREDVPIPHREELVFGTGPWLSVLDEIPIDTIPERLDRWNSDNEWTKQMKSQLYGAGIDLLKLASEPLSENQWGIAKKLFATASNCTLTVAKSGLPAPGGVEPFCQQESYWCSVATASMVAAYYMASHSQQYIAAVTNSGATTGTDSKEMRNYYRDTQKGLGMKNSEAFVADWARVKTDISDDRPVHTCNVPAGGGVGHCRAAFGFEECQKTVAGKVVTTRTLGVVDPWPKKWNPSVGCGEKWEDFDAMMKWNANPQYSLFYHVWP